MTRRCSRKARPVRRHILESGSIAIVGWAPGKSPDSDLRSAPTECPPLHREIRHGFEPADQPEGRDVLGMGRHSPTASVRLEFGCPKSALPGCGSPKILPLLVSSE